MASSLDEELSAVRKHFHHWNEVACEDVARYVCQRVADVRMTVLLKELVACYNEMTEWATFINNHPQGCDEALVHDARIAVSILSKRVDALLKALQELGVSTGV